MVDIVFKLNFVNSSLQVKNFSAASTVNEIEDNLEKSWFKNMNKKSGTPQLDRCIFRANQFYPRRLRYKQEKMKKKINMNE